MKNRKKNIFFPHFDIFFLNGQPLRIGTGCWSMLIFDILPIIYLHIFAHTIVHSGGCCSETKSFYCKISSSRRFFKGFWTFFPTFCICRCWYADLYICIERKRRIKKCAYFIFIIRSPLAAFHSNDTKRYPGFWIRQSKKRNQFVWPNAV